MLPRSDDNPECEMSGVPWSATDDDNLVNHFGCHLSGSQGLLDGPRDAVEQILCQGLKMRALGINGEVDVLKESLDLQKRINLVSI